MTERRAFKRIVRARMEKTGESYTAARASLLSGPDEGGAASDVEMPVAEASVRERTGRGWEEWLDILDGWGAAERTHTEIARHLHEDLGVAGWWAQSVTLGYERARGMRAVGENAEGFVARASRTVAVPVERLYGEVTNESLRAEWLPDAVLGERTATPHRSARYDWGDGTTRVIFAFESKGDAKGTVFVSHERLPDAAAADEMKAMWREALSGSKERLER